MKKKILIIFPNEWLSYTPTILNLVDKISDELDIKIIATDNGEYKNEELKREGVEFIKISKKWPRIAKKIGQPRLYEIIKLLVLIPKILQIKASYQPDEVMAVDSLGLFITQKIFKKCHFISLEPHKDFFFRMSKMDNSIESVLSHTPERYEYLFEDLKYTKFCIPNAPAFKADSNLTYKTRNKKKAIYFGNVLPSHGIYYCLEALKHSKLEELSLTVKGIISPEIKAEITKKYGDLIEQGKLILDNTYIEQDQVIEYLSDFYVGFCFYDLKLVGKSTFNFISCPSGKLFNYYAAGVPVIGSDILGLKSVRDFAAGILLEELSDTNINAAIETISKNHQEYSENCWKAAANFDFDAAVEPYKNYLLSK